MKLLPLNSNKPVYKNCAKYLVKWDKKSKSKYQQDVKLFLKKYWEGCVVYEEFPVFGSRMTIDIYNASRKVAIEMQGEGHLAFSNFFHGDRLKYAAQLNRDSDKSEWCQKNDITLIEVFPDDFPLTVEVFRKKGVVLG